MKLAFGVPWTSPFGWTRHHDTMMNLERPPLARNVYGQLEPLETKYFRGTGWCPARRHIHLCEQALAWGADLILILGADQIYDPDLLTRLMDRWNDPPYTGQALCAMVPSRAYIGWQPMDPFQPMAWVLTKPENADAVLRGEEMNSTRVIRREEGPMQKVNFIGSGVLMFHRDHLLALAQPWFRETVNPQTYERLASMDTGFVWRLQTEGGADVWCDTTIRVTHLHPSEIDDSWQHRFQDWKVKDVGPRDICQYEPFAARPDYSTAARPKLALEA